MQQDITVQSGGQLDLSTLQGSEKLGKKTAWGGRYYLSIQQGEDGAAKVCVRHLNCVQRLFRFLFGTSSDTHVSHIKQVLKDMNVTFSLRTDGGTELDAKLEKLFGQTVAHPLSSSVATPSPLAHPLAGSELPLSPPPSDLKHPSSQVASAPSSLASTGSTLPPSAPLLHTWTDSARSLETVATRLETVDIRQGPSYVSFTNPAYDRTYGKGDGISTWKIHLSIDPQQRDVAWPIIKRHIEATSLKIHGKIHQAREQTGVQPGKEIALLVDSTDVNGEKWGVFLSNLSRELSQAGVQIDPRPMNSDREQATRKWDATLAREEGIPAYYNYRTDLYTVIDDGIWDMVTGGYQMTNEGNVASVPGNNQGEKMVKQSYYQSLPEARKYNPAGENDFLAQVVVRK